MDIEFSPEMQAAFSPHATLSFEEASDWLAKVEAEVRSCQLCSELSSQRTQTVFGTGRATPRVCFVGEAPGFNEDRLGEPFVGQAGQLLNRMLAAVGFSREDVYICNVLKCRPPDNRKPFPQEVRQCRPYLEAQLALLKPSIICCLGSTAAHSLLGLAESMGKLRGRFFDYQGIPVLCTYHPAFLLRSPEKKRDAWQDLKLLMQALGEELPQPQRHS